MELTCKKCNQFMSERESREILEQLIDGLKPDRICEVCLDEELDEDDRKYRNAEENYYDE